MSTHANNEQWVLGLLCKQKVITCQYAFQHGGTTELRVYIARLRRKGHQIYGEWIKRNDGTRYKTYFMLKDAIAKAKRK